MEVDWTPVRWRLLWVLTLAFPLASTGLLCLPGESVSAFFAGEVQIQVAGLGQDQECQPEVEECFFGGQVYSGPDAEGHYTINWDDGDSQHRRVHHSHVRHAALDEACDGPTGPIQDHDTYVPSRIPCTILVKLQGGDSDRDWMQEAVAMFKTDYQPDEVVDGFEWYIILRFYDANRCEASFRSLAAAIRKCEDMDLEACVTSKYLRTIEYIGDDPATRRETGRTEFKG
ncbi:unnamed protein product [Polarella glacialis]|uniref:Uncharacterized protein n=1 Tax=Polarella glacialis TaxID=89957 RepID=A0A813FCL0_POLGL|nr:unnamed protein product [Polarella glacialis]